MRYPETGKYGSEMVSSTTIFLTVSDPEPERCQQFAQLLRKLKLEKVLVRFAVDDETRRDVKHGAMVALKSVPPMFR
jgi:hypothetical protein